MAADADTLIAWVVDSTSKNQGELPAFPAVAARLVDLLEQPDAEIDEVESMISQDQVISAQLLRTANSVLYGGAMPVETVNQAVLRLGFKETAQVAMGAACRSLFSMEDRAEIEAFADVWRAFWLDSLVAGYGARLVSRELDKGSSDRVFLSGMFRNLGGLLVLKIVARGLVRGELRKVPDEVSLGGAIDRLHTQLGANYLRSCHLPSYVVEAAEHHHDADLPFDVDHMDLHILRVADGLCHRVEVSPFPTGELGPLAMESAELFELSAESIEYFELQFQELAGQLKEFV